jgi:hypothetical protein
MKQRGNSRLISAQDFVDLLLKNKGDVSKLEQVVQGQVRIEGKKGPPFKYLHLSNITFTNGVCISELENVNLIIDSCAFPEGLRIERCTGGHLSLHGLFDVELISVVLSSSFARVSLTDLRVEKSIQLYDLEVVRKEKDEQPYLVIENVEFDDLRLISQSSPDWRIRAPMVKTNNPIVAEQFRLAGIPVFMDTATVRAQMEKMFAREQKGRTSPQDMQMA